MSSFVIGQQVEWLTRPMPGGYLRGIVVHIGKHMIKIKVQSPKTGEYKEKWAEPQNLKAVKLWEVREITGYGWNWRIHGPVRFIYATSRNDAKNHFIKAGYKQFKSTYLTAVAVNDEVQS